MKSLRVVVESEFVPLSIMQELQIQEVEVQEVPFDEVSIVPVLPLLPIAMNLLFP